MESTASTTGPPARKGSWSWGARRPPRAAALQVRDRQAPRQRPGLVISEGTVCPILSRSSATGSSAPWSSRTRPARKYYELTPTGRRGGPHAGQLASGPRRHRFVSRRTRHDPLHPEALAHLDDYLAEVRSAVAGAQLDQPRGVGADVTTTWPAALEHADQPVTVRAVADVLEQLGPPSQWVADDRSIWSTWLTRSNRSGTGRWKHQALPGEAGPVAGAAPGPWPIRNWRLSYGVRAVRPGLSPSRCSSVPDRQYFAPGLTWPWPRAPEAPRGPAVAGSARRWSLSVALFVALAFWPVVPCSYAGIPPRAEAGRGCGVRLDPKSSGSGAIYTIVGRSPAWWIILSLVRCGSRLSDAVPPFGARFRRSDALIVLLLSATVFVLWLSRRKRRGGRWRSSGGVAGVLTWDRSVTCPTSRPGPGQQGDRSLVGRVTNRSHVRPRVLEPEVMDTPEEARDYDAMDHAAVNRVFVADFLTAWDDRGRSRRRHRDSENPH